jgi:hypothetical protein
MVASVPVISTKPIRRRGDSNEKTLCEDWPSSNCAIADDVGGDVHRELFAGLGPEPMTRTSLDLDPTAATLRTEPKVWMRAVR